MWVASALRLDPALVRPVLKRCMCHKSLPEPAQVVLPTFADFRRKLKPSSVERTGANSFSELLRRSPVFAELRTEERTAERLLQEAGKHLAGISLSSDEAMTLIERVEKLHPVQKVSSDQLEQMKANKMTYNLSFIINDSYTLKQLVDMGVSLAHWEKAGFAHKAIGLDFNRDVKPRIEWLLKQKLQLDAISLIFTAYPDILTTDLDDLQVRMDYLISKGFSRSQCSQLLTSCRGRWLLFSIVDVDSRLGYFQKAFRLTGPEVRSLAVTKPQLILWSMVPFQTNLNRLSLSQEMGFTQSEVKQLLLTCPDVLKKLNFTAIKAQFDLLHNQLKIPHQIIAKFSSALLSSSLLTSNRHDFLTKLGLAQYDPKQPNYVPLSSLTQLDDAQFCRQVARVPVQVYNDFLRTV